MLFRSVAVAGTRPRLAGSEAVLPHEFPPAPVRGPGVAPLLMTSLLSCSIGVWTGAVFTKMFSTTLKPVLTPTYFAIVGLGLLTAIIGIYLILPMVDKLTRAEANQTE